MALANLGHRGAEGADARTGDGAGILLQVPDDLFRAEIAGLPPAGRYGVATCFMPRDRARQTTVEQLQTDTVSDEGPSVVGWRDVSADNGCVGDAARRRAPVIRQRFVGAADGLDQDAFERPLYVVRRRAENEGGADVVVPSFSSRTVVYKGMLTADQLSGFYPDLTDRRSTSALSLERVAGRAPWMSTCGLQRARGQVHRADQLTGQKEPFGGHGDDEVRHAQAHSEFRAGCSEFGQGRAPGRADWPG